MRTLHKSHSDDPVVTLSLCELLHAIQYERILAYEVLGANGRARQELEKLYAAAGDDEDVAEKLGIAG